MIANYLLKQSFLLLDIHNTVKHVHSLVKKQQLWFTATEKGIMIEIYKIFIYFHISVQVFFLLTLRSIHILHNDLKNYPINIKAFFDMQCQIL